MIAKTEPNYRFVESFDTNLTSSYEAEWSHWQVVREFISNALDSVQGHENRVNIFVENGYAHISDCGAGYSIVFAKRLGASSKQADGTTIGQFGEGTKMALLTCLRNGVSVRIASRDWMIVPRLAPAEEGLEVLLFDIYQGDTPIEGSTVSIEAMPEILDIIHRKNEYFTHFSKEKPLFTCIDGEILPRIGNAKLHNKGVFIKDIEALFSYNLSISELNRDRDLVSEDVLLRNLKNIWESVDVPELMTAFYEASFEAEKNNSQSPYKELSFGIFPEYNHRETWVKTFYRLYGDNAVLYSHHLAAREASLLGYIPIALECYGCNVASFSGVPKDIAVIRKDFEFTWSEKLTTREKERLDFFKKVASTLLAAELPKNIKIFDSNSKSDAILGCFNAEQDEIYLKRELLNHEIYLALDTFIHELNHRNTGSDDYSREFSRGLTMMLAKLCLKMAEKSGFPMTLSVTEKGLMLPANFRISAENMAGTITTVGNQLIIEVAGITLKGQVQGDTLRTHSSERNVIFFKGSFYLNVPRWLREALPEEVSFNMIININEF